MTDIVAAAAAAVDYDAWVKTDQGETIPQSTADARIRAMLEILDLRPGARLMEVGTGSGYSGAVECRIVGETGHVVSIDIDASLVNRAATLHNGAGHTNIEVHASDGFAGWAPAEPYDRIVGWTTPHVIPAAWVEQAAPGAVIVTPVKIADIAGANAVVRCVVDGAIRDGELHPGSFIEMAPDVITDFRLPVRYVDASQRVNDGPAWWLSARVLHDQPQHIAQRLLDQVREAEPQAGFLPVDQDKWQAFNAFLLAHTATPGSLGGPSGWGIGVGLTDSIAVVLPDGAVVAAGSSEAHDQLAEWADEWHELSEPLHDALMPAFTKTEEGWAVRATLRDAN